MKNKNKNGSGRVGPAGHDRSQPWSGTVFTALVWWLRAATEDVGGVRGTVATPYCYCRQPRGQRWSEAAVRVATPGVGDHFVNEQI